MTNYLETLGDLVNNKVVNIDDYYCVTLQRSIQLQGDLSTDLIRTFKTKKDLEKLSFSFEDTGYARIEFMYNGSLVTITLT